MASHQTNYYFLDGRKDTSPGILVIDQRWQFVLNKSNRDRNTFWYQCKQRKTKTIRCEAKATVVKVEVDDAIKFILKDFHPTHNHGGSFGNVIAEEMKQKMCKIVERNPENPVGDARKAVILEYALKHAGTPDDWSEIVENLGDYDNIDKRLLRARQNMIGKAPKNRNDFDPLKMIDDGEDLIVLDSNNLPEGWQILIEESHFDTSSIDWSKNQDAWIEHENDTDEVTVDEEVNENDQEAAYLPKRIVAFTSSKPLKLFETTTDGKASVDGTFKSAPVLWKQVFMIMIRTSGF